MDESLPITQACGGDDGAASPPSAPPTNPCLLTGLPDRVAVRMLCMLEPRDVAAVSRVSQQARRVADLEAVWECFYEETNWQYFVSFTGDGNANWKTLYVKRLLRERLMDADDSDGSSSSSSSSTSPTLSMHIEGGATPAFLSFDNFHASSIDNALSQPQTPNVLDVLVLDDFVVSLNSRNPRAVAYIREKSRVETLVDLVVAPSPPPDAQQVNEETGGADEGESGDTAHDGEAAPTNVGGDASSSSSSSTGAVSEATLQHRRHAYIAYQALTTEVMTETLIAEYSLLDKLFTFLDHPSQNDALKNGYFSKIVLTVYEKFPAELFLYFSLKNELVTKFVANIKNLFVMELLFKFIDSLSSHQWLADERLIMQLVNLLDEDVSDVETQESAVRTLEIICNICSYCPYSVLVSQILETKQVTEKLLDYTLKESPTKDFRMKQGLGIVIQVLNLLHKDTDSPDFDDDDEADPEQGLSADEGSRSAAPYFVQQFTHALSGFVSVLEAPAKRPPLDNSAGHVESPFGFTRLRVLEFVVGLMGTGFSQVTHKLMELDVFTTCLSIFFTYPWNNFIHHQVYLMISRILASGDAALVVSVLDKADFIGTVLRVFDQHNSNTVGYFGHLIELSNEVVNAAAMLPDVAAYLERFPEWAAFLDHKLDAINDICNPVAAEFDTEEGYGDEDEEGAGSPDYADGNYYYGEEDDDDGDDDDDDDAVDGHDDDHVDGDLFVYGEAVGALYGKEGGAAQDAGDYGANYGSDDDSDDSDYNEADVAIADYEDEDSDDDLRSGSDDGCNSPVLGLRSPLTEDDILDHEIEAELRMMDLSGGLGDDDLDIDLDLDDDDDDVL